MLIHSLSQCSGKVSLMQNQRLELGLLDYPQIVKRPMDFATIKNALLKGGKYVTFDDVFGEIQLIWDNCKTYNMAGSEIYKLAEYMEKLSKRTIQKFRSANGIQQAQPPAPQPLPSKKIRLNLIKRGELKVKRRRKIAQKRKRRSKKQALISLQSCDG